ncbi:MAG: methyltransferase family protein [Candidatus Thorarchaeota archaeon]
MSYRRHAVSFILPITVLLIIPALLLSAESGMNRVLAIPVLVKVLMLQIGAGFISFGILLLASTIWMFDKIGKGTLAPWSPTRNLVVAGVYRYVRNPMIIGVLLVIIGEALIAESLFLFAWFLSAFLLNHVYFIKSEEPGLVKRFGDSYLLYKENVPRWLPRRTPWSPPMVDSVDGTG